MAQILFDCYNTVLITISVYRIVGFTRTYKLFHFLPTFLPNNPVDLRPCVQEQRRPAMFAFAHIVVWKILDGHGSGEAERATSSSFRKGVGDVRSLASATVKPVLFGGFSGA